MNCRHAKPLKTRYARSVQKKQGDSGSSGWVQSPFEVPAKATWEDYLALEPKEDVVTEVPIDPYSMDTSPGKPIKQVAHLVSRHPPPVTSLIRISEFVLLVSSTISLVFLWLLCSTQPSAVPLLCQHVYGLCLACAVCGSVHCWIVQKGAEVEESKKKKPKQARRLTGRCWMAEDFPMSLKQLLPILDVIGNANKHIARVGKFLQKYGDMSLFPVKLQVRSRLSLHPHSGTHSILQNPMSLLQASQRFCHLGSKDGPLSARTLNACLIDSYLSYCVVAASSQGYTPMWLASPQIWG